MSNGSTVYPREWKCDISFTVQNCSIPYGGHKDCTDDELQFGAGEFTFSWVSTEKTWKLVKV